MRAIRWFLPTILLALPFVAAASAEEGPHWEANFEVAKRLAAQSNRLVLVHFVMNDCPYCRTLESNVFAKPGVGQAMGARFVLVKLNADDFPATSRQYGIERFPTDVIMTPTGRVLYKLSCPQDPAKYMAQLNDAAAAANGLATAGAPPPGQVAATQSPAGAVNLKGNVLRQGAAVSTPNAMNPAAKTAAEPAGLSVYSQNTYAAYLHRDATTAPPATGPLAAPSIQPGSPANAAAISPRAPAPAPQIVTTQPAVPPTMSPMGLDGFCPVTLIERSATAPRDPRCWTRGDSRWGAVHRGITYLFVGPEEQQRFLKQPDRYAPALSGNDSVMAFDKGQLVRGRREFGIFCDDRIYLFVSAETLEAFYKDAQRYTAEVRQAENPPHSSVR